MPGSESRLARRCTGSPEDARARRRGHDPTPSGEAVRRLANELTVGPGRAHHRRSERRIGRAGSPSDEFAHRRRSALAVGPAHAQNRRSGLTLGRAGSPLDEQARQRRCKAHPAASPLRIGRARSASGLRGAALGRTGSRLGERTCRWCRRARLCATGLNAKRTSSKLAAVTVESTGPSARTVPRGVLFHARPLARGSRENGGRCTSRPGAR